MKRHERVSGQCRFADKKCLECFPATASETLRKSRQTVGDAGAVEVAEEALFFFEMQHIFEAEANNPRAAVVARGGSLQLTNSGEQTTSRGRCLAL